MPSNDEKECFSKPPHTDLFHFAESAAQYLGEMCKGALVRFLLRVDIMQLSDGKMVVNEFMAYKSLSDLTKAGSITPRSNPGIRYVGLQGVSQWSFSPETKILEKDNRLTPGLGIVPTLGSSLATTLNRDRSTSQYLRENRSRVKNAFISLTED
jgi:hypothetical protein